MLVPCCWFLPFHTRALAGAPAWLPKHLLIIQAKGAPGYPLHRPWKKKKLAQSYQGDLNEGPRITLPLLSELPIPLLLPTTCSQVFKSWQDPGRAPPACPLPSVFALSIEGSYHVHRTQQAPASNQLEGPQILDATCRKRVYTHTGSIWQHG